MKNIKTYKCECGEDFYEDDNTCINCGRFIDKRKLKKQEIAEITKEKVLKTSNTNELIIAFVQGAKWWEFTSTGGTMWQSDQQLAEKEAIRRKQNGTLGKLPQYEQEERKK